MNISEDSNATSALVMGGHRHAHKSARRAPGVRAKKFGKVIERGAATQVMIYPRPAAKAAIVEGSRRAKKSLSSFCVMSALKETATLLGRGVGDLGISEQELNNYV